MGKFPFEARTSKINKKPKRKKGGEKAMVLNKPNTQATKQKNQVKKRKKRKEKKTSKSCCQISQRDTTKKEQTKKIFF
jgi:hypothetical protein